MIAILIIVGVLSLRASAAAACARRGLRASAAVLAVGLACEALRAALEMGRSGFPRPYTGAGFALWVPEVALFLLPPAVVLGVTAGRPAGIAVWFSTFVYVVCSYPLLRGEDLGRAYLGVYLVCSILAVVATLVKAVERAITRDEAVILGLSLTGVVSAAMMLALGTSEWWVVRVVNVVAYASTLAAALTAEGSARRRAQGEPQERVSEGERATLPPAHTPMQP